MLPQDQLGDEFRSPLRLDMLQDVNFLGNVIHCLFISFVPEVAFFPPKTLLLDAAAEAASKDPCAIVLGEAVPEFTTLNDGTFKVLIGLFAVVNRRFILVTLR